MPKSQQKLSLEELVQNVEASGAALGERATALSEAIAEISSRLRSMPGKTEASVATADTSLSFLRCNVWGIWLCDSESDVGTDGPRAEELTNVSVLRKARAFPLLVELLSKIEFEQQRQLSEINKAVACLDLSQLRITQKEGDSDVPF